jgi:uncharacterized membrane protein YccC
MTARMRRWWSNADNYTVLKTALASSLAWALATWMVGPSKPYMAALAAILSLNVTVAETLSRGIQRILGVFGGIVAALLVAVLWGMNAWTVGLLVLFSLTMGRLFDIGALGSPQIAISGLMVWSMGHHDELRYALIRFLDTLLGASVAILVNALLHPSDLSQSALEAVLALIYHLSNVLEEAARALKGQGQMTPHALRDYARVSDVALGEFRHALMAADESLRWNVWGWRGRARVLRLHRLQSLLEKNHSQVRVVARLVADMQERGSCPSAPDLAFTVESMAVALRSLEPWARCDDEPVQFRPAQTTADALSAFWKAMGIDDQASEPTLWSVALTIGRMLDDYEQFGQVHPRSGGDSAQYYR